MSIFLLFLGVTYAYQQYQDRLMLREGLLVAFLLGWFGNIRWSARVVAKDIISNLSNPEAFLGAITLGAFTDNAAITYLGSLVEGLSDEFKYYLVAGAVTGGGLTIIANAPNPAGAAILKSHFQDNSIDPRFLFLGALVPTLICKFVFYIFIRIIKDGL